MKQVSTEVAPLPDTIKTAIYDTAHNYPGGLKALAAKMGVRAGTLNNKCDPAMEGHVLNIEDLWKMMAITGNIKVLVMLAGEMRHVIMEIKSYPDVSDIELLNSWAEWQAERGETEQAISDALNNQKITKSELDRIKSEMFEDFQKELALLQRLSYIASS